MASGVKARYNMPEFIPLAGFSPSWEAVFVQIEHWALADCQVHTPHITKKASTGKHFFIGSIFTAKI